MKGRYLGLILCLITFLGCTSNPNKSLILGQWYNESMKVDLDAADGRVDSIFNVPAGQWEAILGIKPILTTYTEDGKYKSEYVSLDGEPLQTTEGIWEVKGDTLFLSEQGQTTAYHISANDEKATFSGYLDWDSDGEEDDFYVGVQIKK